jgi:hypothetical protein
MQNLFGMETNRPMKTYKMVSKLTGRVVALITAVSPLMAAYAFQKRAHRRWTVQTVQEWYTAVEV